MFIANILFFLRAIPTRNAFFRNTDLITNHSSNLSEEHDIASHIDMKRCLGPCRRAISIPRWMLLSGVSPSLARSLRVRDSLKKPHLFEMLQPSSIFLHVPNSEMFRAKRGDASKDNPHYATTAQTVLQWFIQQDASPHNIGLLTFY